MSEPSPVDTAPFRILLVADYFGRDRATGTKRANAFAKYWAREPGVEVVALTCSKPHVPQNPPEAARLGEHVREIRVWWPDLIGWQSRLARRVRGPAKPVRGNSTAEGTDAGAAPAPRIPLWKRPLRFFSDLLVIPDRHALWAISALPRGVFLKRPQVVVATAPAFVNLLIGRLLAGFHRVPYVADMRDPWMTNPFRPVHTGILDRWDRWLERFAVRGADEIWVTTDSSREELLQRLGSSVRGTVCTVSNGYDEDEWQGVQRNRPDPGRIRIVHTGTFYGVRTPMPFLDDLVALGDRLPDEIRSRLDIRFVGPVGPEIRQEAEQLMARSGLDGLVSFLDPVDAEAALQIQVDADVLLLMGHRSAGGASQIPMKVYEYLRAGPSILAYFQGSSAIGRFAAAQPELPLYVADLDDDEARRATLARLLVQHAARDSGSSGAVAAPVAFDRAVIAGHALRQLKARCAP